MWRKEDIMEDRDERMVLSRRIFKVFALENYSKHFTAHVEECGGFEHSSTKVVADNPAIQGVHEMVYHKMWYNLTMGLTEYTSIREAGISSPYEWYNYTDVHKKAETVEETVNAMGFNIFKGFKSYELLLEAFKEFIRKNGERMLDEYVDELNREPPFEIGDLFDFDEL